MNPGVPVRVGLVTLEIRIGIFERNYFMRPNRLWGGVNAIASTPVACGKTIGEVIDSFSKEYFADWLRKQPTDYEMQTRDRESCPIALGLSEVCKEGVAFNPDSNQEFCKDWWGTRFGKLVDKEPTEFITRDRALELLDLV